MEPAQDDRDAAKRELDDILREADEFRRRIRHEPGRAVGDPETAGVPPRLEVVPGGAARDSGASRVRIVYEGEALRLVRPEPAPNHRAKVLAGLRIGGAVGLVVLALWVWARFPSGPPMLEARPPGPAYVEASARYALWVTAQRVDRYASEHHALPSSLAELETSPGTPAPELIGYERVSADAYRLIAPGPEAPIRLDDIDARRPPSRATRDALRGNLWP